MRLPALGTQRLGLPSERAARAQRGMPGPALGRTRSCICLQTTPQPPHLQRKLRVDSVGPGAHHVEAVGLALLEQVAHQLGVGGLGEQGGRKGKMRSRVVGAAAARVYRRGQEGWRSGWRAARYATAEGSPRLRSPQGRSC